MVGPVAHIDLIGDIHGHADELEEPLKDDLFKCLEARPSVLKAREIGERIVERMKEYVEVFVKGMVA